MTRPQKIAASVGTVLLGIFIAVFLIIWSKDSQSLAGAGSAVRSTTSVAIEHFSSASSRDGQSKDQVLRVSPIDLTESSIEVEPISKEAAEAIYRAAYADMYGTGKNSRQRIVTHSEDFARKSFSTTETSRFVDEDGFVYTRQVIRLHLPAGQIFENVFLLNKEGSWRIRDGIARQLDSSALSVRGAQAVASSLLSGTDNVPLSAPTRLYEGDRAFFGGQTVYVVRESLPEAVIAAQAQTIKDFQAALAPLVGSASEEKVGLSNISDMFPKTIEYVVNAATQEVLVENRYAADGRLLMYTRVTENDRSAKFSIRDFQFPIGVKLEIPSRSGS